MRKVVSHDVTSTRTNAGRAPAEAASSPESIRGARCHFYFVDRFCRAQNDEIDARPHFDARTKLLPFELRDRLVEQLAIQIEADRNDATAPAACQGCRNVGAFSREFRGYAWRYGNLA